VNQIGSVTESIEAVKMSKHAGWGVMASHRRYILVFLWLWLITFPPTNISKTVHLVHCSGETEDTFIADLSVGLSTVSTRAFPKFLLFVFFTLSNYVLLLFCLQLKFLEHVSCICWCIVRLLLADVYPLFFLLHNRDRSRLELLADQNALQNTTR